jgi:hypothetical protein
VVWILFLLAELSMGCLPRRQVEAEGVISTNNSQEQAMLGVNKDQCPQILVFALARAFSFCFNYSVLEAPGIFPRLFSCGAQWRNTPAAGSSPAN